MFNSVHLTIFVIATLLFNIVASLSVPSVGIIPASPPRIIVYYQTQFQNGVFISPTPLTPLVTHLVIAAFHLNANNVIHLNDNPPDDPIFDRMWVDVARMQRTGVKVMALLGGAAPGTFGFLDTQFDVYYKLLSSTIREKRLDGIDLDVEDFESLDNIGRLIQQFRTDFGPDFIITFAPVASALSGGNTLSGFDYKSLEQTYGHSINWYNAQFYSGFGSLEDSTGYDNILSFMPLDPTRLVALTLTNPDDGFGFVDLGTVNATVRALVKEHGNRFGGIAGWEYFNSMPDPTKPWEWAIMMREAIKQLPFF